VLEEKKEALEFLQLRERTAGLQEKKEKKNDGSRRNGLFPESRFEPLLIM